MNSHIQSAEENDPLNSLLFITIPDSFHHHVGEMEVDPAIALPVHVPDDPEEWDPESLTYEMLISGMLTLLSVQPEHEHAEYYRSFVTEARPDIFKELSETGIIAAGNEDYQLAEEIFCALAGLAPDRIEGPANLAIAYENRADNLERTGREEEAELYRERASGIYRDLLTRGEIEPNLRLNAGLFMLKVRNFEGAREQLQYYVQESKDPDKRAEAERLLLEIRKQKLHDEMFKEAYDFIRIGDEERGIQRIRQFLELHPHVWNGWFLLGWGLRRLNRYSDAAAAFQQAIETGADNGDTYNELAICQIELGDYEASRKNLEMALRIEPDNTKIISNFGVLFYRQEDFGEARRYFATVLELEPEDSVALHYLQLIDAVR